MQLLGGAEGLYGVVVLGQVLVGQKPVDAAVAGLAQVHYFAVAAAFLAGHQVVAAGVLHGARAQAAAALGGALGARGSLGSSLS